MVSVAYLLQTVYSYAFAIALQAAFARAKKIFSPQSTGAVLCGQKQMAEVLQYFL